MQKQIKLFSWNVNGVRSVLKKGVLQSFIEQEDPDILCLQEIKAHESQVELDFPQYIEYWNSAPKSGYSGTAIFTKQKPARVERDIAPEIADQISLSECSFGSPNSEGRVLAAEFDRFWLVNVYTPNTKPDLSRLSVRFEKWDPAFLTYCKELEKTKPVVICGDMNVAPTEDDLANPKSNKGKHGFTDEERAGFQKMMDAGFVDTFRMFSQGNGHYSWWSNFANSRARNIGWRIDFFLVSESLRTNVSAAKIYADIYGSDHCPVSLTLTF